MNNQVSRLLDVNFPDPNHSNFNLGRKNTFSADVGYLYPIYVEEVLASSYKKLDLEALVQCNATVAPVMGSFTTKVEAYFVPIRLYHQHLLNNDRSNNFADDFELHYFPWLHYSDQSSGTVKTNTVSPTDSSRLPFISSAGSLVEYLGMYPTGFNSCSWTNNGTSPRINAYPFIGYFDIFRNYYSNPYDTSIPFRVNNSLVLGADFATSADGIVSLNIFDKFINGIRTSSLNSSGTPVPVNVFESFCRYFKYIKDQVSYPVPLFANTESPARTYTLNGIHFGLLRRTYKDDYFNARISSDFVTYLKEQSRVQVNNNTFDITQLRLANRIAKYVDKLGFSDSRFGSWLKAHFGTKLNDRMQIPQFLGSMSSTLVFQDIISNAQTGDSDVVTSNEALGSRAGLGSGYMKNQGSFIEFKAVEPGYIIVLFSIVPNVSYTQGIRKMYLKSRFSDIYTPEFDAVGYQDLHKVEMSAIGYHFSGNPNLQGPLYFGNYNTVVGKHPSWMEYMTSIDESHGLVTEYGQYGYWTLNRPFDPGAYFDILTGSSSVEPNIDVSTYIRPEYFNQIFAVNRLTDNFQVQFRFYDKTSQPMSKQVLPRL